MTNRGAYFQRHYYFKQNPWNMERYLAVFSKLLSGTGEGHFPEWG